MCWTYLIHWDLSVYVPIDYYERYEVLNLISITHYFCFFCQNIKVKASHMSECPTALQKD